MLTQVVIVCLVIAGFLVAGYLWCALPEEVSANDKLAKIPEKLGRIAEVAETHQTLSATADLTKEVVNLVVSLRRSGTRALLIAFGLLIFAGIAAAIDDKVPDPAAPVVDTTHQEQIRR